MHDETTDAQRFKAIKQQLIAATGSSGLTSFRNGMIHLSFRMCEQLISKINAAQEAAAAQIKEMQSRELHHFEEEQISANAQAVLDEALRLCNDYRVPGKHETWDAYHEGRSAFADEIQQILDRTDPPHAATHERISSALNRAADEVLKIARDDGDELLRDAVNLVVNAGLHFLEHPDASLEDAVRENYDDNSADELLDSLQ